MTGGLTYHLVRVFVGPTGYGGNDLAVFVDGEAVPPERRQAVASDLKLSETVFVEAVEETAARLRIHTPTLELAFAGHPAIGTAWLLRHLGRGVELLQVPAGEIRAWRTEEVTWIRARPEWVHPIRLVEFATPGEVEALSPPPMGDPGIYAWAWEDAGTGILRARYFGTDIGIPEDEATGAAAVLMGARHGWPLTIRQGRGSELYVRPGPQGSVEIGGRVVLVGRRPYGLGA